MESFCVYLITNLKNNKIYVGATSKGEERWKEHLSIVKGGPITQSNCYSYIHRAINKHGENNFSFSIIEYFENKEDMFKAETAKILEYRNNKIPIYNLTNGGEGTLGYQYSDEQKAKMSERMRGRFKGEDNPFYGKTHTLEAKDKISAVRKANKFSPNYWGENSPLSKFKESDIISMIEDYQNGMSANKIAEKYNTAHNGITRILKNESWIYTGIKPKHVRNRSEGIKLSWDKKYGELEDFYKTCPTCKEEFSYKKRPLALEKAPHTFCSNKCRLSRFKTINNQTHLPMDNTRPLVQDPDLPKD